MNRRLKYVPMLCVCLIGMLVSCGTVKRASGLSGNKAVVEEKEAAMEGAKTKEND